MRSDSKKQRVISSMTGFGRAVVAQSGISYVAEARSVNNRHVETRIHGLHDEFYLEFELTKMIKSAFHRGKFDLVLKKEKQHAKHSRQNLAKLKKHAAHLSNMQKSLGLKGPVSFETILNTLPAEHSVSNPKLDQMAFTQATKMSLEALKRSRQKEGKALSADLKTRIGHVQSWIRTIEKTLPKIQDERRRDVRAKIESAIRDLPMDAKRIEAEIALMIEKMDVTEETVRFANHLQTLQALLFSSKHSNESVGRELDFTIQEMGREINTLGAKIGNAELSKIVVNIKSEMEKIREQVQNIE